MSDELGISDYAWGAVGAVASFASLKYIQNHTEGPLTENMDWVTVWASANLLAIGVRSKSKVFGTVLHVLPAILQPAISSLVGRRAQTRQDQYIAENMKNQDFKDTATQAAEQAKKAVISRSYARALDQYRIARRSFSTLFQPDEDQTSFRQLSLSSVILDEAQLRLVMFNYGKATKRFSQALTVNPKDSQAQWGMVITSLQEVGAIDDLLLLQDGEYCRGVAGLQETITSLLSDSELTSKREANKEIALKYLGEIFTSNRADDTAFLLAKYLQGSYDMVIDLVHMHSALFNDATCIEGNTPSLELPKNILLLQCYGKALLHEKYYSQAMWVFRLLWFNFNRSVGQQDQYTSLLLLTIAAYQGLAVMQEDFPEIQSPFIEERMTLSSRKYLESMDAESEREAPREVEDGEVEVEVVNPRSLLLHLTQADVERELNLLQRELRVSMEIDRSSRELVTSAQAARLR